MQVKIFPLLVSLYQIRIKRPTLYDLQYIRQIVQTGRTYLSSHIYWQIRLCNNSVEAVKSLQLQFYEKNFCNGTQYTYLQLFLLLFAHRQIRRNLITIPSVVRQVLQLQVVQFIISKFNCAQICISSFHISQIVQIQIIQNDFFLYQIK